MGGVGGVAFVEQFPGMDGAGISPSGFEVTPPVFVKAANIGLVMRVKILGVRFATDRIIDGDAIFVN